MASISAAPKSSDIRFTYLVGIGVTHSVAPPMHDEVASALNLPWKFKAQECSAIQDVLALFKDDSFAGGVVTMPYKISIMNHLGGLDDHARLIGACNNVYKSANGTLRGSNTDWRGIQGCLVNGTPSKTGSEGRQKPALIIGAGGAARAAVYTLHGFQCSPIYVVNRDEAEVHALMEDTKHFKDLSIIYLTSATMANEAMKEHGHPYFLVGTVPDLEPKSQSELEARAILEQCLSKSFTKGVVLDMCFKPRNTRLLKLAAKNGWPAVEGVNIIGYQIEEQYRLWTGPSDKSPITKETQEKAWTTLCAAADSNSAINF